MLYSVPQICHPISCQVIDIAKAQYSYLQGPPFADNPTVEEQNEMPIDILVGSDQYWAFIEGSIIQGDLPVPEVTLNKTCICTKWASPLSREQPVFN